MIRMRLIRFWLPLVVTLVGAIIMIVGLVGGRLDWAEGGALIVSAGLSIWLLNFLYRVSVHGDREREAEEDARDFFARHGRWPDDEPPPPRDVPRPPTHAPAPPRGPGPEPRRGPHRTRE